jgi:O-antigen/teichoic acid export membrane protein
MLIDPLYQSIYPELARLWATGEKAEFRSLVKRTALLVGSMALVGWIGFAIIGRWAIVVTVGQPYQEAYLVAVVYMFALVIAVFTFSFHPSMLAMGLPGKSLRSLLLATAVYFMFLLPLVNILSILGAAISYVLFYVVWSGMMLRYLKGLHMQQTAEEQL